MIRDSKRARMTVYAFNQGYRIDQNGDVVSSKGVVRKRLNDSRGYFRFTIRGPGGEHTTVCHHQLCAYQKYGEHALFQGIQVRHLDGDPTNNRSDNIAIGTASDNIMDMTKEARLKKANQGAAKRRKFTPEQIAEIRNKRVHGAKLQDMATEYQAVKSTISYIVNRKTYSQ